MTAPSTGQPADAAASDAVRWTHDQLASDHSLPLARVLDLLEAADERQAVQRMLGLLRATIDAGPAIGIEYVLHGGVLKPRQIVPLAGGRIATGELGRSAESPVCDSAHGHLVALARGLPDDAMFGLLSRGDRWLAGQAPEAVVRPERVSVLYTLAPHTAWAMHFCPCAPAERFADDVLIRLPSCALLVREVHRIVTPAATLADERVDSAEIRLGVRAASLSGRERQICARIAGGRSTTSIAAELGIATSTVMTLRKRAYAKLGIHDRLDLCHLAA